MSIKGFNINGQVQKYDYTALENLPQDSGLSEQAKQALLACFQNVAWINADGQTYYDALEMALSPATMYSITNNLTGCTTSNSAAVIAEGSTYTATITASSGCSLEGATATATMGGQTVTGFYNNGTISIPNVTGDLVITVTATSSVASISAVFTQGDNKIYSVDSLDALRNYLVVTVTHLDGTTSVVTDYTLSGDLTYPGGGIVDLLDGVTWTDGIAYDDDGNELDRPTLSCSDFIPVTSGVTYTYKKPYAGTDPYGMLLYLYDSNKDWVGRETTAGTQNGSEYVKSYIPTSSVAYVRLCSYVDIKSDAEFLYDSTPASWNATVTALYAGQTDTFSVTVTRALGLFLNGDECVNATGGWTIGSGFVTDGGKYTLSKNDGQLSIVMTTVTASAAANSISTNYPVNLTSYDYLVVEYEYYKASDAGNANAWIYLPTSLSTATTQNGAYGSDYSSHRVEVKGGESGTPYSEVKTVDLSGHAGSRYLSLNFNTWYSPLVGCYIKVSKIYLK